MRSFASECRSLDCCPSPLTTLTIASSFSEDSDMSTKPEPPAERDRLKPRLQVKRRRENWSWATPEQLAAKGIASSNRHPLSISRREFNVQTVVEQAETPTAL